MSEEKIVYIPKTNTLLHESFALLSFKERGAIFLMTVITKLLTLVHKPNIFLLQFIVLTSNKVLSKNNFEVNL